MVLTLLIGPAFSADCVAAFKNQDIRWITAAGDRYHQIYARALGRGYGQYLNANLVVDETNLTIGDLKNKIIKGFPDGSLIGSIDLFSWLLNTNDEQLTLLSLLDDIEIIAQLFHHKNLWVSNEEDGIVDITELVALSKERTLTASVDRFNSPAHISLLAAAKALELEFNVVEDEFDATGITPRPVIEEVDFAVRDFKLIKEELEDGDLVPLLQMSASRRRINSKLSGVPFLAGTHGIVNKLYPDNEEKQMLADIAIKILELGIVIVASNELGEFNTTCVTNSTYQAISSTHVKFTAEDFNESKYRSGAERVNYLLEELDAVMPTLRSLLPAKTDS